MAGVVNLALSVLRIGDGLLLNGDLLSANGDSPQLTQTGIVLMQRDLDISGAIVTQIVGGAGTPVQVTGSGPLSTANFTGLGNVVVSVAGTTVRISGTASAGDVTASQLTATGVVLGAKIDSLSGWSASATNLAATGTTLNNRINTTQSNLTSSGITLGNQITSLSGWAASESNLSTTGNTLFQRDLDISGALASQIAGGAGTPIQITGSSNLTAANFTGLGGITISLLNTVVTISGAANEVTSAQLTSTGVTLGAKIDSLSGWSASLVNLASTGSTLDNKIVSVSGWAASLANLYSTGSVLDNKIVSLSGWAASAANLAATGTTLDGRINTLTNNLTSTGITLGIELNSLSGWAASSANLAQTGTILDGRINTLTVNLGTTGTTLFQRDLDISGALASQIVGGAGTPVQVTGSSNLSAANFTGLGGITVSLLGSTVTISSAAGEVTAAQLTATGVTLGAKIDSLSGWSASTLNLATTGSTLDNKIISVSGWAASTINLASTGTTLNDKIVSLSGWAASSSNLTQTGVTLDGRINILTSNLTTTGVNLGIQINSLSGWAASAANLTDTGVSLGSRIDILTTNLTNTGVTLGNKIDSLSGWATNTTSSIITNLGSTGSVLDNKIISLSGWAASSANLETTGSNLQGQLNTLTANLTSTGVTLGTQINSLSGWAASTANLTNTGQLLSAFKVTGSNTLNNPSITGDGTVVITRVGLDTILVSGSSSSNQNLTGPITSVGPATSVTDNAITNTMLATGAKLGVVGITVDGGGSAITAGVKGYVQVPYNATITGWFLRADTSGSIIFDVWKRPFNPALPPTVANTIITPGNNPSLTGNLGVMSSIMTGWERSVTGGNEFGFNVNELATSITRATLQLYLLKTI